MAKQPTGSPRKSSINYPKLATGQLWQLDEDYHRNDPSGTVEILDFPKDEERKLLLVRYRFMGEEFVATPERFVSRHFFYQQRRWSIG